MAASKKFMGILFIIKVKILDMASFKRGTKFYEFFLANILTGSTSTKK